MTELFKNPLPTIITDGWPNWHFLSKYFRDWRARVTPKRQQTVIERQKKKEIGERVEKLDPFGG